MGDRRTKRAMCRGRPLPVYHDEVACHAQGEKRNEIIRLLNCWINTIEGPQEKPPQPCKGSHLCYPWFSCTEGTPYNTPQCIRDSLPDPIPKPQKLPEFKLADLPTPVWKRPRVKSAQIIGGGLVKVKECFRANGLNDFDYCPRTESCQVMCSLEQIMEEDRRLHGEEVITEDCCCRPGDAPSRIPQYKCMGCGSPSQYGYKEVRVQCPAERGTRF